MFDYPLCKIMIFVKHLKSAKKDSSLSEIIQKDAQDLIIFFTQKISKSKQDPHLAALELVSFDFLFPEEMEKAIQNVSDDGYGKIVEFLRARPLASRES